MREWLSGRASPCQGERSEFESRLPLHLKAVVWLLFLVLTVQIFFMYSLKKRGCRIKNCIGLLDFRCRTDKTHPTVYVYTPSSAFCS